jgi:hypothetical protein
MRRPGDPTISTDAQAGETFTARWARVKRGDDALASAYGQPTGHDAANREQQDQAAQGMQSETSVGDTAHAPDGHSDADTASLSDDAQPAPLLTDADMPALRSIGDDDDYSGFMSPGVSEALRNKALRQLFMSAQFNVLDGLNDYDDDFTTFEALGDIVTSDMRHRVEMEAEQAARDAEQRRLEGAPAEQEIIDEDADLKRELESQQQPSEIADEVRLE